LPIRPYTIDDQLSFYHKTVYEPIVAVTIRFWYTADS